jgi:predicted nucleotidyltransferase
LLPFNIFYATKKYDEPQVRRAAMGVSSFSDIQKFASDVAREFAPEKVILFGSYATGTPRAESDVDLLVIMPGDVSGVRVAADIISRLQPTLPLELIVRSSRQIRERMAQNDFFLREIMATGKELYAAPHH